MTRIDPTHQYSIVTLAPLPPLATYSLPSHTRASFGTPFISFGVTNDDFENGVTYKNFVRVNLAARAEIQVPFFGSESLIFWQ